MKISYIGMKAQEVSIKPGTMKIVMQPDAEVLDEVVVTGMTKVDKRLFTGANTSPYRTLTRIYMLLIIVIILHNNSNMSILLSLSNTPPLTGYFYI